MPTLLSHVPLCCTLGIPLYVPCLCLILPRVHQLMDLPCSAQLLSRTPPLLYSGHFSLCLMLMPRSAPCPPALQLMDLPSSAHFLEQLRQEEVELKMGALRGQGAEQRAAAAVTLPWATLYHPTHHKQVN